MRDKNQSPESIDRPTKILKLSYDQEDSKTTMIEKPKNIQRYLVEIEYIGTKFSGAEQRVPHCRSVAGVLQSAFHKFIRQPVSIYCSVQTGAGVHALSNFCHVDVERISKRKPGEVLPPHEPSVVKKAVNHFLRNESDILITDVRCVAADFHARDKAQERTYYYRLLSGPEFLSPFEKGRAWHVPVELDLSAMQKACKVLEGLHDFSFLGASSCQVLISSEFI